MDHQVETFCNAFFIEPKSMIIESESSDSFSDADEEDQKDYRVGGYHPVEVLHSKYS